MNEFYERLSDMMQAYAYDNEHVEFIQWYFSDQDTDNFTERDANNIYDIVVEIAEQQAQSPDSERFDFMNTFSERVCQYKRDNGYLVLDQELMDSIATYMDDDIREELHAEMAPCEPLDFLKAYVKRDEEFLKLLEREFYYVSLLVKESEK